MAIALACDECGVTRDVDKQFLQWGDDLAWVMDLCPQHADEAIRRVEALFPYGARTTPRSARALRRASTGQASYNAATGVNIAEVRSWAQNNDIPVSGRGRVDGRVIELYRATQEKGARYLKTAEAREVIKALKG